LTLTTTDEDDMTLAPFLTASPVIQIHAIAALLALLLGPFAIYRRRRDRLHRLLGYAWATTMALTAASSFFIFEIRTFGPFSPIHALSILALASLWVAVRAARARRIDQHRAIVTWLYWGGLAVAGMLTMMPGRIMHRTVFGADADATLLPTLGVATLVPVLLILRQRRSGPRRV
jgi:uncharacterized membrane protein